MKTKTDDNQSGNSIVRGFSDSGLDVMEGEKYMIDTKERIARSNIYSIFGKLMNRLIDNNDDGEVLLKKAGLSSFVDEYGNSLR